MDHLPDHGASEPIEVPFPGKMYDGQDFDGYPSREGWDSEKLQDGNLDGRTAEDAAAFLQAWLYFGLLSHIFRPLGSNFNPNDFTKNRSSGEPLITTVSLSRYLKAWNWWELSQTHQFDRSEQQRVQKFQGLKLFFGGYRRLTWRYCQRHDSSQHQADPQKWPLSPEVALSILILADTLALACFEFGRVPLDIDWGASPFLVNRMKESGWCMTAIQPLTQGQQLDGLYYASTLGPPPFRKLHDGCDEKVCKQEQIRIDSDTPRHRSGCSGCPGCPIVEDAKPRIIEIIKAEQTPLVGCKDLDVSADLEIIKARTDEHVVDYVAISHVWSDGLGNPRGNTLPACQVRYLQQSVDALQGVEGARTHYPWWCDILCIPTGEEHKEYKRQEVRNMRKIYRGATKVLVIDNGLVSIRKNSSAVEIYVRLRLSGWTRRLWTLQEAILGKEVHLRLADGTKTLRELDATMAAEGGKEVMLYQRFRHTANGFFLPLVRSQTQNALHRSRALWMTVQPRYISHRADETLCLATLLDIDPDPLFDIADEDYSRRIIKLLQTMKTIPLMFLFQPPPRLTEEGFRWAPASFLNCFRETPSAPFRVVSDTGQIGPDERGLLFSRSGIEITVEDPKGLSLESDFGLSMSFGPNNPRFCVVVPGQNDPKAVKGAYSISSLHRPHLIPIDESGMKGYGIAVLVDAVSSSTPAGCLRANFIATVNVLPEKVEGPQHVKKDFMDKLDLFSGRFLLSDQSWLIY